MEGNYFTIIATVANFVLVIAVIIGIYKATKGIISFNHRNKELDKKVDLILSKLDNDNKFK